MSLSEKPRLSSTKANVPNIRFTGLPCRLCQSDAPYSLSFSPTGPDSGVNARNEVFKELILVRVAGAAIFQSQKPNKYILWFYYNLDKHLSWDHSLENTKSPLLWTYALQTIYFIFYVLYILISRRVLTSTLYTEKGII